MRLQWEPEALDDRISILEFLRQDKPRAAIEVDDRIVNAVSSLKQFPEKGRKGRSKGTREPMIPRTRYMAAYCIEGDTIIVKRILDGARRWPRKLTRH